MVLTRSKAARHRAAVANGSIKPADTPKRARLRQAIRDLEAQSPSSRLRTKRDVFSDHGVDPRTAYRWLKQASDRTILHSRDGPTPMGRPKKLTPEQLRNVEDLMSKNERDGRRLTWDQLVCEAGLKVSGRTLRRAMGPMNVRQSRDNA